MNTRLVARVAAVAAVAAAVCAYWYSSRDTRGGAATPRNVAQTSAATQSAPDPELATPAGDARAALGEAKPVPPASAPPANATAPQPEPIVLAPSATGEALAMGQTGTTTDPEEIADPDGFAAKYVGYDVERYRTALDAVEAVLAWQYEGKFDDKSQALPQEALEALERERAWLKVHAFP
jgi:hypothetical protein